jgi:hypothetical protein
VVAKGREARSSWSKEPMPDVIGDAHHLGPTRAQPHDQTITTWVACQRTYSSPHRAASGELFKDRDDTRNGPTLTHSASPGTPSGQFIPFSLHYLSLHYLHYLHYLEWFCPESSSRSWAVRQSVDIRACMFCFRCMHESVAWPALDTPLSTQDRSC